MNRREAEAKQADYAARRREHTERLGRSLADEVEQAARALEAAGIDPSDVRVVAAARKEEASRDGS